MNLIILPIENTYKLVIKNKLLTTYKNSRDMKLLEYLINEENSAT